MFRLLDDGCVTEDNYHTSKRRSNNVRKGLSNVGFIPNDHKSIWEPCKLVECLGLSSNSQDTTFHITDRRLTSIYSDVVNIISFKLVLSRWLCLWESSAGAVLTGLVTLAEL